MDTSSNAKSIAGLNLQRGALSVFLQVEPLKEELYLLQALSLDRHQPPKKDEACDQITHGCCEVHCSSLDLD